MGVSAFYAIIIKFAQEVGANDAVIQNIRIADGVILAAAFFACFLGFNIVRLYSAVMSFFLTAIVVCELMRPVANMGAIVITFAVVGLTASFIIYYWYKPSVFLFSAMMGYSIAAAFTANVWICFGAATILGGVSFFFPSVTTMFAAAVWGGIFLGVSGLSLIGVGLPAYQILSAAGLAAAGLFTQYSLNKTNLMSAKALTFGKQAVEN